jgi:hypothetical protein
MKRLTAILAACVIAVLSPPTSHAQTRDNPFAAFIGQWTLKDDTFQQVWDGKTVETLTIPSHHTDCQPVNTAMSIMCVVSAGDLQGHIFWAYDATAAKVYHLSHFGERRLGSGTGTLNAESDLTLTLSFTDEPAGSYRVYEYSWVSADEYHMISRQYAADGTLTGNWYGGTFVRLP